MTPISTQISSYVHSGRGGAGNWSSQPELQRSDGSCSQTLTSEVNGAPTVPSYRGRGGAGNWIGSEKPTNVAVTEQKTEQEANKRVAWDVGLGLQPPKKAHLVTARVDSIDE